MNTIEARATALLFTVLITYLSLLPSSSAIIVMVSWDKLAHLLTYAIMATLYFRIVSTTPRFLIACLFIIIYSGIIEIIQASVGRTMSIADFIANVIGVLLGVWSCYQLPQWFPARLNKRLQVFMGQLYLKLHSIPSDQTES